MILHAKAPEKPAGILIDSGTGKRIPFGITVDLSTGEYEHYAASPDGKSILCSDYALKRPIRLRGKAVGKLSLVPLDHAAQLGAPAPPRVYSPIAPISQGEIVEGLQMYEQVHSQVWQFRGESRRCAKSRFADKLRQSSFLDHYILGRTTRAASDHQRGPKASPPGSTGIQ
jgi:hypothetical protein